MVPAKFMECGGSRGVGGGLENDTSVWVAAGQGMQGALSNLY